MDVQVSRADLHVTRVVESAQVPLATGQARLTVDAFGLSTNNITYAAIGDLLQYWSFFPAEPGWGRVPVWGFAEVAESTNASLPVGTRVFGYLPMSQELVVTVGKVDQGGFDDASEHRQAMASAYNRYQFAGTAALPGSLEEDCRMLLYPLFFTAFLVDDFLGDSDFFGASVLVLSSASSKTSLGIARHAASRQGIQVVGLTSSANLDFTRGLGIYDLVLAYESESELPPGPAVYVDVSGSASVRAAVHLRYGDDLRHDMILGATHHQELGDGTDGPLEGPTPTFFFAPTQITKRSEDWGQHTLDANLSDAWSAYWPWAGEWITFRHGFGVDDLRDAYLSLLDNQADPTTGHILSLTRPG